MIMSGYGLQNKLKMAAIVFLRLISRIIAPFRGSIRPIENLLWSKVVVKTSDGYIFALVDRESYILVSREFEDFMLKWFTPRKGEVFIDIGAHVGKYTVMGAKAVGEDGQVIAIEPHPLNYRRLLQNIKLNRLRNVTAINIAAWNARAKIKLFIHEVGGHHSVKSDVGLGFIQIDAARIDDMLSKIENVHRVDWIKIDVEGAEYEVLQGLKETIRSYKPKIIMEVFYENIDKVRAFLKSFSYNIIRISPFFTENVYFFCIFI